MSQKYPGGFITKSPVAPTATAASGVWTLDQQQQAQKAGTWPSPPIFIEDLFSTWLYTGTGGAQTINNGIDLTGKGGLVWIKSRNLVSSHSLFDTTRGAQKWLGSNSTNGERTYTTTLDAFGSTGFTVGGDAWTGGNGNTYASWTFREQPKFFDVVTWTGNNTFGIQNIPHNLGAVPGCIIIKCFDVDGYDWVVYHRSLGASQYIVLNTTSAASATSTFFNDTAPTATQFTVGTSGFTNGQGQNYVAYLFAHDAGGFPASGTGSENGISCGSFTYSAGTTVDLGYEPQAVLFKVSNTDGNWFWVDNMRGWTTDGNGPLLSPNTSGAEGAFAAVGIAPTATGFRVPSGFGNGNTIIYIAIRRGPMKTPTTGTSVYSVETHSGAVTNTKYTYTTNFPVDLLWQAVRAPGGTSKFLTSDRLRAQSGTQTINSLVTASTSNETDINGYATLFFDSNTSFSVTDTNGSWNGSASYPTASSWALRRAPGFFDEVCWTNNSNPQVNTHNLGVRPELAITKTRNDAYGWFVGANIGATTFDGLELNSTAAGDIGRSYTSSSAYKGFTATTFTTGGSPVVGAGGFNCVTYLFASAPGVSKVGSFTGTGATQVINCGFTTGARFVLIKANSTTGDWYVWDSARGIVAGNDPYLRMNVFDAEVTTTDWVDTAATGFELSNAGGNLANSNGVSYIFLAIA